MSSLDVRNNSAVMKRAEQLKRWEESDTNREPSSPRPENGRRIKFSSGCVFLAACLAGDKEEVIKLLDSGADINTANVDGLTALHQACIDDNLEMVEFLVEHGADINRQDNEGWTPLHATASCGFVSIARYLVEHGADVAAVNSDGDLAVDLAVDIQHLGMIDFMQKMVAEHSIDCEKARQAEEQQMLNDAKRWLRSDASEVDRPHPKTGATALHVAAAKGYTKVLSLLLAGRANVDRQDNDGWTPLHAASHWSQKEAAEMLVDAMADMDVRNYAGQSCIDVAERKMVKFLEELRTNNKRLKRRPSSQINSRISETIENHIDNASNKIIRVEVRPDQSKDESNDDKSKPATETVTGQLQQQQPSNDDEAPWRRNSLATRTRTPPESPVKNEVPDKDAKSTTTSAEASDVILRRTQSFENDEKKPAIATTTAMDSTSTSASPTTTNALTKTSTITTSTSATTITTPVRSDQNSPPRATENTPKSSPNTANNQSNNNNKLTTAPSNEGSSKATKQSAGNILKNFFKSFVPPVRDEESETQRKAHAKRVRETRRSTQGVTLDEIKSAEELVKKKNSSMASSSNTTGNSSSFKLEDASSGTSFPPTNSTIIPSAPAVIAAANLSSSVGQRRINSTSNAINSSTQSLNSVGRPLSAPTTVNAASSFTNVGDNQHNDRFSDCASGSFTTRRLNAMTSTTSMPTASNTPFNTITASSSITNANLASSHSKSSEDKENDKENDSRSSAATQAVLQRRRKPKRRSTGVVHLDMEDLDLERQEMNAENDDRESGNERGSRSRIGSTASSTTASFTDDNRSRVRSENGGELIDYKALWEAVKLENDKLKQLLKKKDDEVVQSRATLDRFTNATTKNSLSEIEKRERRAMERKLSEMEEELKQLEVFKTENQRLKEENGALIRVISKLSK